MKDKLIQSFRDKINEIEVTKDNNKHWNGVKDGLSKAINITRDLFNPVHKSTAKTQEAEKWVNDFIIKHHHPPTYKQVAEGLNLASTNTAYHRLRNYRHMMKSNH